MASTGMNRKNFIKKSVLGISGFSMLSSFGESKDFRDEKHGGIVLQENQNISAMDTLLFKRMFVWKQVLYIRERRSLEPTPIYFRWKWLMGRSVR